MANWSFSWKFRIFHGFREKGILKGRLLTSQQFVSYAIKMATNKVHNQKQIKVGDAENRKKESYYVIGSLGGIFAKLFPFNSLRLHFFIDRRPSIVSLHQMQYGEGGELVAVLAERK